MPAQSTLGLNGFRSGLLGSNGYIAVAMPLANGDYDQDAHTDATRLGWYGDRTASDEALVSVVEGVDTWRVGVQGAELLVGQLVVPASTTSLASQNIPHGTAPSAPVNGDFWSTTAGFFGRVSGVTVGPFAAAGGTVTSVALAAPSFLTVSGSPVTTSGTLTLSLASQTANTVFAAPDGSAGAPTFRLMVAADLPNTAVTPAAYGSASSVATFTVDAQGRLTAAATTAILITASQVSNFDTQVRTSRLDQMAVPTASVSMNSQLLVNVANPVSAQDAATKSYVDTVAQGLSPKASARLATAAVLPNTPTYANGASGVGATLTAGSNGALSVDGVAVVVADRILVKNQASSLQNGIYTVTAAGSAGTPYVLTRSLDFDQSGDVPGAFVFVQEGSTQADTGWVCTTDAPVTMGTTAIVFTQFSGAGSYLAGAGLTLTGNTFSVNVDNVGIEINANNLQLRALGVVNGNIANGTIDLTTKVTGILPTANGGTGLNGSAAANGTLLIGNGAGYTLTTLTAGTGVSITNGAGSITINATGTGGTVTSVALAAPSIFSVSGSPITTAGTLTLALVSQTANTFFAAPDGSAGAPTFRLLVAADLPVTAVTAAAYGSASAVGTFTVDAQGRLTAAATVPIAIAASQITSGLLSTARGGTGVDGSAAANGSLLIGNGAGYTLATLTAGTGISITNGAGSITIAAAAATSLALANGANTVATFLVDNFYGAVYELFVTDDAGALYTSILTVNHNGTTGADATVTNWTESNAVVTGSAGVTFSCTLTGAGGAQVVNLIATAAATGKTLRWARRLY